MTTYHIEKFVTIKESGAIGEHNEYQWQPLDGEYSSYPEASEAVKILPDEHGYTHRPFRPYRIVETDNSGTTRAYAADQ